MGYGHSKVLERSASNDREVTVSKIESSFTLGGLGNKILIFLTLLAFGKQHNRDNTQISSTSATRHDNPGTAERPEEPYPISAGQTPVAYGLPPGSARPLAEFVNDTDENKVERKLNLLDLVSQLRDRDV